jgi:hypothetical protein
MHFNKNIFFDWDDFNPASADIIITFYRSILLSVEALKPFARSYTPVRLRTQGENVVGVQLNNGFVVPAKNFVNPVKFDIVPKYFTEAEWKAINHKPADIPDFEWQINKDIAYDSKMRLKAFEHASEEDKKKYVQLESSSIQDEIEDVYQHLRLTFSSWLARSGPSGGSSFRKKLEEILKRYDIPVFEKRKRLDIMLEGKITGWLEPSDETDETELGFLRVDCIAQGETGCTG